MKVTPEHNERMAKMTFASVYPLYITKVEKKGRTIEELHQVISWLFAFVLMGVAYGSIYKLRFKAGSPECLWKVLK